MSISGPVRAAVDIGGTFTDLQILDLGSGATMAHKTPTTPDDPSEGLIRGLAEAAERFGFGLGAVERLMHGTTIATNAVIMRRLPAGALITTAGFEDVLEIGRHERRDIYANRAEPRTLLIPRARRFGAGERTRADGTVEAPLDEASVRTIAARIGGSDVRAVAVCLLHAYANPAHELRVRKILAEAAPDLDVSLSHEVAPEIREFERTSTTVLNALLVPVVRRYLERLETRMTGSGLTCPVYLVQSNGGVTTPAVAARLPARLLLSGPSGGARAAEVLATDLAEPNLVAVDMGGTSYDVSVVNGGSIRQVTQGDVAGCPVRLPMIEIRTIGAGGGSLARVDETGRLHVGPESAGAVPGPACYGRGGTHPTVTDANVALGRIDPAFFLGGGMTLDVDAARRAIETHVAAPTGLSMEAAAEGMLTVVVAQMAAAIRLSLFEKGLDPEDFALVSFGGAGGLHACDTAAELGAGRVLFPRDPGTLSAWGMLYADIVHDLARSRLMDADDGAVAPLAEIAAALETEAGEALDRDGVAAADRALPLTADLRYPGQAYEIQTPLAAPEALPDAVAEFHRLHMTQYAHAEEHVTPQIVTLRLAATGRLAKPGMRSYAPSGPCAPKGTRRVHVPGTGWADVPVHDRDTIGPDDTLAGPVVVEEGHSTLWIPAGWRLAATPTGELVATREGEAR